MLKIDVVCPLNRADEYIDGFLSRLKEQQDVEIVHAVFAITSREDDSTYVADAITEAGYTYFTVSPTEFSHSLTRQRAIEDYCESDRVVMLSQDVRLVGEHALFEVASAVGEQVAFAYGRQIAKKKDIECYVRRKNYGETPEVVSAADIATLGLHAFFASDAFAAYYRPTFLKLGGYDHIPMMMNEDMYYAKKLLDAGYQKAYVPTAVVEHSHTFTLKQLYRRYYAAGEWFTEHPEFSSYKTTDTGLKLALSVFGQAIRHFNLPVLFRFLPDMTARYLGLKAGKKKKKEGGTAAPAVQRGEESHG
jgi:rhamnosyltransferase